jgi:hypothetical protein
MYLLCNAFHDGWVEVGGLVQFWGVLALTITKNEMEKQLVLFAC